MHSDIQARPPTSPPSSQPSLLLEPRASSLTPSDSLAQAAGTLRSLPVQVRLLLVLAAAGGTQRGARFRQFSSPLLLLAEKSLDPPPGPPPPPPSEIMSPLQKALKQAQQLGVS
ncbi:hypothetical protein AB1E18_008486 [Capra hircus]